MVPFWCPLEIKTDDSIIWTNPLPNFILYSRPVCLVREKEKRAYLNILNRTYQIFMKWKLFPAANNGYNLNVHTEISMINGRMADILRFRFLQAPYLVSGQTHTWSELNTYVKVDIANVKEEVITNIKSKSKFVVDSPDSNAETQIQVKLLRSLLL